MERRPGSCDLFANDPAFCEHVAADLSYEPEFHTLEAISSFLTGCHWRPCLALDLGANIGWFTAYMLSLGANVTAVEPQPDLAEALRLTVELNCWTARARVVSAFASSDPSAVGVRPVQDLFRYGAGKSSTASGGEGLESQQAALVSLDSLLLPGSVGAGAVQEFELIKMDADGPEGSWLWRIDRLLSAQRVRIRTLVVECNDCGPELLYRFQRVHGYEVYLLNVHQDKRFLNARGIDVYSLFRPHDGPPWLEELFSIRFMRHVYHFVNMTLRQWHEGVRLRRLANTANQYVLTKEPLLEPRREHPLAISNPSDTRIRSGYQAPEDGIGGEGLYECFTRSAGQCVACAGARCG